MYTCPDCGEEFENMNMVYGYCRFCDEHYRLDDLTPDDDSDDESYRPTSIHDVLEFGKCSICGENAVLPREWVDICPNCMFFGALK